MDDRTLFDVQRKMDLDAVRGRDIRHICFDYQSTQVSY